MVRHAGAPLSGRRKEGRPEHTGTRIDLFAELVTFSVQDSDHVQKPSHGPPFPWREFRRLMNLDHRRQAAPPAAEHGQLLLVSRFLGTAKKCAPFIDIPQNRYPMPSPGKNDGVDHLIIIIPSGVNSPSPQPTVSPVIGLQVSPAPSPADDDGVVLSFLVPGHRIMAPPLAAASARISTGEGRWYHSGFQRAVVQARPRQLLRSVWSSDIKRPRRRRAGRNILFLLHLSIA